MFEPRALHGFDGLLTTTNAEAAGLWVQPLSPALATVAARKGQASALSERIAELYGLALPHTPSRAAAGAVAFVGVAPGTWLAVFDGGAPSRPGELAEQLKGLASVADQSGGQALLRLGGPAVGAVLAAGLFLDLHLSAFPVGGAAASNLGHVGVTLWRIEEAVFDLVTPRSFAADIAHGLQTAAEGHGLVLRP
jgi:heterotetrameric sarcosine oxidase gamma subunit